MMINIQLGVFLLGRVGCFVVPQPSRSFRETGKSSRLTENCFYFHREVMRKISKRKKKKKELPVPICLDCTEVLSSIDKPLPTFTLYSIFAIRR